MRDLLPTLLDYDPGMLAIIARRWDVDLETLDKHEAAETLAAAMLDPQRCAAEWARLTDQERGALQTLLGASDYAMPQAQFSRFFGEMRQMDSRAAQNAVPDAGSTYGEAPLNCACGQCRTRPDSKSITPSVLTGDGGNAQ